MKTHGVTTLSFAVISLSTLLCVSCSWLFPPGVVGTWQQDVTYTTAQAGSNPTQFRFQFIFGSDKTYVIESYVMNNSQYALLSGSKGPYTTNGSIISTTQNQAYQFDYQTQTGTWVSSSGTGSAKFSIAGSTMTLTVDMNNDGKYDTSHPITDYYPGGGTGSVPDITYTLTKVP